MKYKLLRAHAAIIEVHTAIIVFTEVRGRRYD